MSKLDKAYELRNKFNDFCKGLEQIDRREYVENEPHLNIIRRNLQTFFEKQAAIHYEHARNGE